MRMAATASRTPAKHSRGEKGAGTGTRLPACPRSALYPPLKTNQFTQVIDQAGIALQRDPTDQAALYQEIQAQRRLGNKEALQALVKRLEELKRQQQVAQAQYLLEDANTNRSSP